MRDRSRNPGVLLRLAVLCALTVECHGRSEGGRSYPLPAGVKTVKAMAVDRHGMLWIGTNLGLLRLDGVRYTPFGAWVGVPEAAVESLAVGLDGALWIGMGGGVYRLDGQQAERVDPEEAVDLQRGGEGMFAVDRERGLRFLGRDGGGWKRHRVRDVRVVGPLYGDGAGVTFPMAGNLVTAQWMGDRVVVGREEIRGGGEWQQAAKSSEGLELASSSVAARAELRGKAWEVVTRSPIRVRDPQQRVFAAVPRVGDPVRIHHLNYLYFPFRSPKRLEPELVLRLDGWRLALYEQEKQEIVVYDPLGSSLVLETSAGLRNAPIGLNFSGSWMATTAQGIYRLWVGGDSDCSPGVGFQFHFCPWNPQVREPFWHVHLDAKKRYWAVHQEWGLVRLDVRGQIVEKVPTPAPLRTKDIREILETPDGRLFVSSKIGMYEVLVKAKTELREADVAPGVYNMGFTKDRRGRWWALFDGVLALYEDGTWKKRELPDCLWSKRLRGAAIEEEDRIWFAMRENGGFVYTEKKNGGEWTCETLDAEKGFPQPTHMLRISPEGRIFRASRTEVFAAIRENGRPPLLADDWVRIGEQEGLSEGDVHMQGTVIGSVARGESTWITTTKGVTALTGAYWRARGPVVVSEVEREDGTDRLGPVGWQPRHYRRLVRLKLADLPLSFSHALRPVDWRAKSADGTALTQWTAAKGEVVELAGIRGSVRGIEFRRRDGAAMGDFVIPESRMAQLYSWRWEAMGGTLALCWLAWLPLRRSAWWERMQYHWEGWRYSLLDRLARRSNKIPYLLVPGQRLRSRYEVDECIAQGGFSEVYRAHDVETGEAVAVKALSLENPLRPDYPAWLQARFLDELRALRTLRHPGIVEMREAWIEPEGVPCIAMPLLRGETLRHILKQHGRLPLEAASRLIGQVGEALQAAHDAGIVHSDVKPENIMIRGGSMEDWQAIVIDFGTSQLRQQAGALGREGQVAGTLAYMAPEQAMGRTVAATDLYALGLVALEMLTGVRGGTPEDALDAELQALLREALAVDPAERPMSAAEWARRFAQAGKRRE